MENVTEITSQRTASGDVDVVLSRWKNGDAVQRAREFIERYGLPEEVSSRRLIWHNNGPWKWSMIVDEALPHRYPKEHQDYLTQVTSYRVNRDKASDCLKFDGSVNLDVVAGEVGSRCSGEDANFITTNLAVEIMEGRRSWQEARRFMAETMRDKSNNEYLERLLFEPMSFEQARNAEERFEEP